MIMGREEGRMKGLDYVSRHAEYGANVARHSPWVLGSSLLVGLGSWGTDHAFQAWAEMFQPAHIFSLMGVVGAVLIGYFGGRPPKT